MDPIRFPVSVEVSRKPKTAVAVACYVAAALLVVAVVLGIWLGLYVSIFVLVVVGYLLKAARGAVGSREMRTVQATASLSAGELRIDLPATRLYDGEYLDQRYRFPLGGIAQIKLSESGVLLIRGCFDGEAVRNGAVVETRHYDGETLELLVGSQEGIDALRGLLANMGM